jgi:hypothetical protein
MVSPYPDSAKKRVDSAYPLMKKIRSMSFEQGEIPFPNNLYVADTAQSKFVGFTIVANEAVVVK